VTVVSVSIPEILEMEIDALVKRGYYNNKSEIFREALRNLFATNQTLRTSAVVELYQEGRISLGKAAEMAGLCIEEMKEVLASQNITIDRGPADIQEMEKQVEQMKKRMK
jgi:predicted HTH domain antitoxin